MPLFELTFASGEDSLSVRRFTVREGMSSLFEVSIWARSPNEDIDLEAIVGKPAALRVVGDASHAVRGGSLWTGVCSFMEQEQAEETGLSTYHLRVVPSLWLLGHRRNYRIFQRQSVPEIVGALLGEWAIEPAWRIAQGGYPKLEYRVQYGESDLAFACRLLEEAGISYFFEVEDGKSSALVLTDRPHAGEARAGGPLAYTDSPSLGGDRELVTQVKVSHEVRPGKVTIRDFDFRNRPEYKLFGAASAAGPGPEERLEQYHYEPGAFVVEGARGGEGQGAAQPSATEDVAARASEREGKEQAERRLASERAAARVVSFKTNALDVRPGVLFSIAGHARSDLGPETKLLATELALEGTHEGAWTATVRAALAKVPYYPAKKTAKPRVYGVQSAIVVGPKGHEIHTDDLGRVRVQFHWDREASGGESSSCWMRVSQGWAGGGFGVVTLPRVGQEVLVGFFEGDPDHPVVVGRVFNSTTRVPYRLPEHKTKSTWKSSSSPGAEGFNELMFEDAKGQELVYLQAERNKEELIKVDEQITVGNDRTKLVKANETETTGLNRTITVGVNRTSSVGVLDTTVVGVRHAVTVAKAPESPAGIGPTGTEMVDRRITLTTGEATITLEGPNITLDAAASILLSAAADITITGRANIKIAAGAAVRVEAEDGDLILQGGPMTRINPEIGGRKGDDDEDEEQAEALPVLAPPGVDVDENVEVAEDHKWFNPHDARWFDDMMAEGGPWDYKRMGPEYEDFGSFHYGVVGKAMGLPEGVLLRRAGKAHEAKAGRDPSRGDPGNGVWGGSAPYGNDPRREAMIRKGFEHYGKRYR